MDPSNASGRELLMAPQIIEAIGSFIASSGGDEGKAYLRCGIPLSALHHDVIRIRPAQFSSLLEVAVKHTSSGDPLSLQILRHMPVTAMGKVGIASMTAATLDEALDTAVRYMPLDFPFFSMHKSTIGNTVRVVMKPCVDMGSVFTPVLAELQAGMFNKMGFFAKHGPGIGKARALVGMETQFRHAAQGNEDAYLRFFGVAACFNGAEDQFVMSRHALHLPLMTHNQSNHTISTHALEQRLQILSGQITTTVRVQQLLRLALSEMNLPKAEWIAQELNVSTRTLSRRLRAEGSNLNTLIEDIRLEQAKWLLTNSDMSISVIAEKMGFSSISTFSRAFSRLLGFPPSALRSQR